MNILGPNIKKEEISYLDELQRWDFNVKADSIGASIYEVMITRLKYEIFHDELGDKLYEKFASDKIASTNLMVDIVLNKPDYLLLDREGTAEKETLNDAVIASFKYSVEFLKGQMGDDIRKWKWGSLHQIEFSHLFSQEKMLKPLFNFGPFPFGGDEHTINRAGFDVNKPYKVNITASIRYIIDFSNLDKSLAVMSTGQCAQLLSRYRTDMSKMFLNGEYITWSMNKNDAAKGKSHVLKIKKH
jgi:penicillin amidase